MDRPTLTLAEHKGFGKIYQCECGSIHVQAGPVSITFSTAGYMQFVELVNTSAANFETVRSELDAL